jgi:chromosome segregation ATPase
MIFGESKALIRLFMILVALVLVLSVGLPQMQFFAQGQRLEQHQKTLEDHAQKIDEQGTKLLLHDQVLAGHAQRIHGVEAAILTLGKEVEAHAARLTEVESGLAAARTDAAASKEKVAGLERERDQVKADLARLSQDLTAQRQGLDEARGIAREAMQRADETAARQQRFEEEMRQRLHALEEQKKPDQK